MQPDASQRMSELLARIEAEDDRETFSTLVEELNRMLDDDQPVKKPPAPAA